MKERLVAIMIWQIGGVHITGISFFQKSRFILAFLSVCGFLVIGAASIIYMWDSSRSVINQITEARSRNALAAMDTILNHYRLESKIAAENLAKNYHIIRAVEAEEESAIREIASRTVGRIGINVDLITITNRHGSVIARTHSNRTGDSLIYQKNIIQALAGEVTTHIEFGNEIRLSVRTGAPVKNAQGEIIGVVTTGYSLIDPDFVEDMKAMTGNEFSVFIGDERVNTTILKAAHRAVGTKMEPRIVRAVLENKNNYIGESDVIGTPYFVAYKPVLDPEGNVIGAFVTGIQVEQINRLRHKTIMNGVVMELALIALVTAIILFYVCRVIAKPLVDMEKTVGEVTWGNPEVKICRQSKNQIGMIAEALCAMAGRIKFLDKEIQCLTKDISIMQEGSIMAMAALAEMRDKETGHHLQRAKLYIKELAEYMGKTEKFKNVLTPEKIKLIVLSSSLHDIGKVGIPDKILLKPGPLSVKEYESMKEHSILGSDVILYAGRLMGDRENFLTCAREMAYSHHEKWDGTGYPQGLSGEDIPLPARLMSVVDAYDALTSQRIYKEVITHEEAVSIIQADSGKHFDPDVVNAFLALQEMFKYISER